MRTGVVRPIAICVFQYAGKILVCEFYDPVKNQTFYRPPGGTIEFGETSQQTVYREIQEELGLQVSNLRFLVTLENIFSYNGQEGHEIVLVYDGEFVDPQVYEHTELMGTESNGLSFLAKWKSLTDFNTPSGPPLYPSGLLEYLGN